MRKPFAVSLNLHLSMMQRDKHIIPCCTHCGSPASKEALFKDSEAIIIEKYCDDCIKDPARFREILKMHHRWTTR